MISDRNDNQQGKVHIWGPWSNVRDWDSEVQECPRPKRWYCQAGHARQSKSSYPDQTLSIVLPNPCCDMAAARGLASTDTDSYMTSFWGGGSFLVVPLTLE